MTDTIQPLLERIQNEGLKKSEAERDRILAEAKSKASGILEDARGKAEKIVADAEKQAEASLARGQTALEQAARDLLLKLRTEIARQLNVAAEKAAGSALESDALISDVIRELAASGSGKISVESGEALAGKLKDLLPALLKDAGKESEIIMNPKTGAGFRLSFGDSPEAIDFTSQAVADWLSQHLRPELAALVRPEDSGA